jgi:hypothetical protein
MRNPRIVFALTVAMLTTGCVPSLHPLYTEQDLIFEPGLVGTWVWEDGHTWTFRQAAGSAYQLISVESGVATVFNVHLVRLGNTFFLDFFPEEPANMKSFYRDHLIPAHTIAKVGIEGDLLHIAMMGSDWLKERLDIPCERLEKEEQIVITASTTDLQRFVRKYAEEPLAFGDPETLRREKLEIGRRLLRAEPISWCSDGRSGLSLKRNGYL